VQRNDRAASISRDDKHCGAGEVLPPRFVHAASTTLTLGSLPVGGANQAGGKVAPGTLEGAFTRWRIGGGARGARGAIGAARVAKAIAISGRSARQPAAKATAREAADGSQMSVRLRGGLARVR